MPRRQNTPRSPSRKPQTGKAEASLKPAKAPPPKKDRSLSDQEKVLAAHTAALTEHERKIANHTAIQSWIAMISLAMTVVTTAALIFIAHSQYKVSERQVALDYAKSAPQFSARVFSQRGEDSGLPTGVEIPTGISLQQVHGDITIKSISVIQEISVRRTNDIRTPDTEVSCTITFQGWFDLAPDRLETQANSSVFQLLPSLSFMAADGRPAYLDRGATRIFVKYDDLFGQEHVDIVTVPVWGEVTVSKDVKGSAAFELVTAYLFSAEKRQPFNVFNIPPGCRGILTKE